MIASGQARWLLAAAVLLAALAGALAPGDVAVADPGLVPLIRFMAVLKGGMALAAFMLLDWRLRAGLSPVATAVAVVALASMAAASGLIWSLAHVALGAVLFHIGLLTLLALAWREARGPSSRAWRWLPPQRGVTWTATSFLRRNGSVQGGS